jgi:hypothetical protein
MTSGDQFISDEELPPPNVLKIDVGELNPKYFAD